MREPEPNIKIPVDLTNPGQFFACCGLLELADRLWLGAEGWFTSPDMFLIRANESEASSLHSLCKEIAGCDFDFLLPDEDRRSLEALSERKWKLKRLGKSLPKAAEKERKLLSSKRIASGFSLGPPFSLRVDWWLIENCDGDHLKTWAGLQTIATIAQAIHACLEPLRNDLLLEQEVLVMSRGKPMATLSFDSGRVGTAQDIGYSPDDIRQPISCCVWTEFLTLIALQRFALRPDPAECFAFFAWHEPLLPSVAAAAARGLFPQLVGCEGRFTLAGRDSGNRYKAFQQATLTDWRH